MSRLQKGILVGVVLIGVYVGMKWLIGVRVAGYLDDTATRLIEHEHVQVNRMDYERGLFRGRLDYDIVYRPPATSPAGVALRGLRDSGSLDVRGSVDIVHGPWLPGSGPGLAVGEIDVALPDQMRSYLPQYPATEPLVTMRVISGFDGQTTVDVRVIDYQGQLVSPGEPIASELVLAGLRGTMTLPASLDAVTGSVALQRLHVNDRPAGMALEMNDFESTVDLRKVLPMVWTGHSSLKVQRFGGVLEGERRGMEGLAVEVTTRLEDEWLNHQAKADFDAVNAPELQLGPGRLRTSAHRIDADAYRQLVALSDPAALQQGNTGNMGSMLDIVDRLLATGPELRIDEVAFSLVEEYDTRGSLSVAYTGPPQLSMFDLAQLNQSFTMEVNAATTESALERVVSTAVALDMPQATAAVLEQATDEALQQTIDTMTSFGVQNNEDGSLTFEVALLDGQLTVNGEPSSIEALMSQVMTAGVMPTTAAPGRAPDVVNAVPRETGVFLSSGFTPDPHIVTVMAGGGTAAANRFGGHCSGYTEPDRANLVLEYEAGMFPLYVSASSSSDTTLVVMAPDGEPHCNDDHEGLHPAVSFEEPATGVYRIWVGTYQSGNAAAELSISELAQ